MRPHVTDWSFRCAGCGTWASTLSVSINLAETHRMLDEERRELGLAELRHRNLRVVVDRLLEAGLEPGSRLLDVGSAHGWFLQAAADRGMRAEGIEPDEAVAARAAVGRVRVGFFPDVLGSDEEFDAVTFNDVLEHLPDADAAVAASASHLAPGGLLSINIPNRRGLFYRLALVAHRLGLRGAFERLWQVGLPSPHLWYFDSAGLVRLGERHGLRLVRSDTLDSVRRRGLWHRAHADRRPSPTTVIGFATVWLLAPVLNARRASDIIHLVFRKPPEPTVGT
jgi:SAM-dependent methyltransferase